LLQSAVSYFLEELGILFSSRGLPLRFFRVGTPTCWTQTVEVVANMVPAKGAYLVSTWTWLEVAVLDVEFLHAERTGIISILAFEHSV
jgi:hypothetical protein